MHTSGSSVVGDDARGETASEQNFDALEKAPSASYFFAENGEESYVDIAKSVSEALGLGGKTISWPADEAIAELGDWACFAIASNSRVRATHARNLFAWVRRKSRRLAG